MDGGNMKKSECLWDPTDTTRPGQRIGDGYNAEECREWGKGLGWVQRLEQSTQKYNICIGKIQRHIVLNRKQTKTHRKLQGYNTKEVPRCWINIQERHTGLLINHWIQRPDREGDAEQGRRFNKGGKPLIWKEMDDIKGKVEMLRGRITEHSRNDGKLEEKTLISKQSRDEEEAERKEGGF